MRAITNIFLTDDDADDCLLFSEIIQEINPNEGTKLTISNDGAALMKTLDETVPPPPEVIFLDLNMPRKNGFECLEEIRNTPKLMEIPVVIFSTSSSNDIVDRSYKFGANYYICKPQSYTLLKKTIAHVLSLGWEKLSGQPNRDDFVIKVA
ncbi:MAG TPA: response regulator [Flavobacterium sp.]|jgi:CheY-like chemotaxis protein|nr:response regulator [Flavobacterium sp.]HPJ10623.1 response regulator [Flavobacterium sp.]